MLAAALALVVALLGLEAVLRWGVGMGDPPIALRDAAVEYRLAPAASYRRWGNRIEINSQGLRAPEFDATPAPDERRALLIGDSIVYGNHFLDQPETVAYRMTQALAEAPSLSGCVPLAIPMATSSWGPVNEAAMLAREGAYGAEAALIVVSAHDMLDVPDGASVVPYRLAPSWTAIGDALTAVYERHAPRWLQAPPPPPAPAERRKAMTLAALDAMQAQLTAEGAWVALVYHPMKGEAAKPSSEFKRGFENWARRQGVPFVDLGEIPGQEMGYRDGLHPDARGAAAIAEALAEVAAARMRGCEAGAARP
ncbi:hypothetical protein [uncultured Albimonas sp.]|uniref:hypothetical protein n=1 Tax=uncultured Albimonas sp. TaxID=1331701 RepID=UPI0030EE8142|tara:strand:+ start:8159 stop:9088 length:930 start_codon:yes stop_codon:yes gene_type:complete